MSVKSKHSATRRDKNFKKEKRKSLEESNEEIESSEEELDLTKECHPIGYYINDRAEMINQMFSVIKGNKLKAMLPPILKDCDTDQLKLQCLDQLLGMSDKRIMCILEGGTLESSSESEVLESDEYESDDKNGTTSSSSSNGSDETYENGYCNNSSNKHKKRKSITSNEEKGEKKVKKSDENSVPEQGKTLLEILELEMRARAIRALLKQSGNEKEGELENDDIKMNKEKNNDLKETFNEVVDLTECEDEESFFNVKIEKLEENIVNKKMLTFNKDVKSKNEEPSVNKNDENHEKIQGNVKNKNKLIKKKIYRTRQQMTGNDEEKRNTEMAPETEKFETQNLINDKQNIKIEPKESKEPEEILVEDPEEGEISSSEEDFPVEIKQEIIEENFEVSLNTENKVQEDETLKINVANNDNLGKDNTENMSKKEINDNVLELASDLTNDHRLLSDSNLENLRENETKLNPDFNLNDTEKNEKETIVEETSWRDRWLQKDGVQKLVKSSKIYAKVKKRIAEKSLKAKEEAPTSNAITSSNASSNIGIEVIEGSIEEYEKLFGRMKEKQPTS